MARLLCPNTVEEVPEEPKSTGNAELDAKFVKEATEHGLCTLKGHKLVGGMRASIYNAMPVEGIKALVEFMAKFERENG